MPVSTAVVSTRSLRPRVTFRPLASWTTRSLSFCTVCGPIVFAQRISTVSSGTAVEPHDHEHAEDHLDRCGAAAVDGGQGVAPSQIGADAGEQLVIIEEAIELGQLGLELQPELGDEAEEIDGIVAVAEHRRELLNAAAGIDTGFP